MNETGLIEGDEISLFDLINPLIARWKTWVGAAFFGVVVGAAFWASKGFEAELAARPVRTLEFAQWRSLSNGLPALAENLRQIPSASPESKALFDVISQPGWWAKNVTPEYTYSKSDIKELSLSDKQLETNSVSRLIIRGQGTNRDEALRMAQDIERHIREGGVYIAAKSVLNQYALDAQDIYQKLQAKISKDMLELEYLNKRAEAIESLQKKYPDNEKSGSQAFLDPKDNAAKYLPLGTQLVAVKTDINAVEESLSRSNDRLEELKVVQQFLSKGLPLLERETSGFALLAKLSEVEKEMRRSVDASNLKQILALNLIAEKLAGIEVGYGQLFEENSLVTARRAPKLPIALGLVAGLLLGVMWVLFSDAYRRARG